MELSSFLFPNEHYGHVLWGILIVLYPFMTCSIFGGLFVSSLPTLFGRKTVSSVRRVALAVSLSFIPFAFFPILLDIGRPLRAFNIMITPRFTSPMAVFGFIFSFVAGIIILQAWLTFRSDLIQLWNKKTGFMRLIYSVFCLGMNNDTPQAQKIDRGLVKFLQVIGIPAAAILPGYVAFDFSTCPGNPWWNSSIRPLIFLITGIVNGVSLTLIFCMFVKPRAIPDKAIKTLARFLIGSLAAVVILSVLEISVFYYSEGYGAHVTELLLSKEGALRQTFFINQLLIGTCLPILLLCLVLLARLKGMVLKLFCAAAGAMGLFQTFWLLWNVVIGGQSISKNFKGIIDYSPGFTGQKGIIVSAVILILPVFAFVIIRLLVPLVKQDKDSTQTSTEGGSS